MAGNTLARDWDLSRILQNYEDRINVLEKLALAIGSGSAFLTTTPRWRSRLAADASIAHNTLTNVAYSTVGSAPDHDPGTPAFASFQTVLGEPRIVFATAGLYLVRASVQWNGNATGTRKILLYRNATAEPFASVEYPNAGATAGIHQEVMEVMPFAANDYLKVGYIQYSGGNLTALAGGSGDRAASWLRIVPVGAYAVA